MEFGIFSDSNFDIKVLIYNMLKVLLIMSRIILFAFLFVSSVTNLFAQVNIGGVINDYAAVTAINSSTFSFTVESGRGSLFADCNKVLIIQMKGASINEDQAATFGDVSAIGNAGNYEIRTVESVSGDVVRFSGLTNSYDVSGKVQLIPVPEYPTGANITSVLTCDPWDGDRGGVLIFEASTVTMNNQIDVTGMGFRPGYNNSDNIDLCSISEFTDSRSTMLYRSPASAKTGGEKGEGIAESQYMFSIGKLASGGGGGGLHNGSGGGGASYAQGGSGATGSVNCPNPNIEDGKGQGGTPLSAYIQAGRAFLGGGGGAGHGNNGSASPSWPNANNDYNHGGHGGGIVIIKADVISTTWAGDVFPRPNATISIIANGEGAPNKIEEPYNTVYYDGAGGGGGAGTVILEVNTVDVSVSSGARTLAIEAKGGRGGDTQSNQDCYAPGGGGGGGAVIFSSAALPAGISAVDVTGGEKGVMLGGQESTPPCQIDKQHTNGFDGDVLFNSPELFTASCCTPATIDTEPEDEGICEGTAANFSVVASGTGTITYQWEVSTNNGTSWSNAPGASATTADLTLSTVAASADGNLYRVKIYIDGDCEVTSEEATLSVTALPVAPTLGDEAFCVGETVTYSPSASTGNQLVWYTANAPAVTGRTTTIPSITTVSASSTTYFVAQETTGTLQCESTARTEVEITVNALPSITGTLDACVGGTASLTGSGTPATSNAWTSATTSVGTVNGSGVVTGVLGGTTDITYVDVNGCEATEEITINALPSISGTLNICDGETTQLTGTGSPATSNAWTSATTAVGTISATGLVTGVADGSTDITYTDDNGCANTATVTVNALPTITGTLDVCENETTQLTGSGTAAAVSPWTSATLAVATVDNSGEVSGVSNGSSVIMYTDDNGCQTTETVTVNDLPSISGTLEACVGQTTQLTGSGVAGTTPWTSGSVSIGTINNTGLVSGVAGGTTDITYSDDNGCQTTETVTINALPTGAIAIDKTEICQGGLDAAVVTFTASGGTGPYTIAYTVGTTASQENNVSSHTENITTAQTITITSVEDANGCNATDLGTATSVTTTFIEEPTLASQRFECNPSNPTSGASGVYQYRMIIEAADGDASSYDVSGTFGAGAVSGSLSGSIWTSDWVVENSGDAFSVDLTDVNACNPITITGDTVCSCAETATIGVQTGEPTAVCVQGDVTTSDLQITFNANGSGATSYDFDIYKDGVLHTSVTGHDGSPYALTGESYGEFTLENFQGVCFGSSNTFLLDTLTSPSGAISALDDTLCVGVDSAKIQVTGINGSGSWDITVNADPSISADGDGIISASTAGVYAITEIKDGNGCTAKDVSGLSVVIGSVDPATGAIIAPESIATGETGNHIFNPSTIDIEAAPANPGYEGEWGIDITNGDDDIRLNSPLSSPTNTVLGMEIDDVVELSWTISDIGDECPDATAILIIERKGVTTADVSGSELCADFSGFTLEGNGLVPGETAVWSVSDLSTTSVTVTPVAGTNGKQATVSGFTMPSNTSFVDVIFEYEVTPIVGLPTADTMLVRIYAEPTSDPGADEMMCGDAYQLKAPELLIGEGLWTADVSSVTFDDATQNDATASNLPEGSVGSPVDINFTWTVSNGVCASVDNVVTVTRSGNLTTPNPSVIDDIEELCITNLSGINLTGNPVSPGNSETSSWSVSPTTGVTLTTTADDENASASFSELGIYEFTYTIDNPTCNAATGTVSVEIKDIASISEATIAVGCEGDEVVASVIGVSSSTETIQWAAVSGAVLTGASDQANTTFTLANDGTISSEVTVTPFNEVCGDGASVTATNTINLLPREAPDVVSASGTMSICQSGNDSYTASNATETGITGYNWTWEGLDKGKDISTGISLDEDDYALVSAAGNPRQGIITVVPVNACGTGVDAAITTQVIDIVTPGPIAVVINSEVDAVRTDKFCIQEDEVVFEAYSAAGEADGLVPDYQFSIDDVVVQAFSPAKTYTASIGELEDGTRVKAEVRGAEGGCYTTTTNETTIVMDGYNQPSIDLNTNKIAICETTEDITILVEGLQKGDSVTSWSLEGVLIPDYVQSLLIAESAEDRGVYTVVVDNEVCDENDEASTPYLTINEKPIIDPFSFIQNNENRLVVLIDEEGLGGSRTYPVSLSNLDLDLNSSGLTYEWQSTSLDVIEDELDFNLEVTNETSADEFVQLVVVNGQGTAACKDSSSFTVAIALPLSIPNAFTPNGDGINDKWVIQGMNDYPNAVVTIFNRWGAKLYERFGGYPADEAWDGNEYPVGTYYFIVKLNDAKLQALGKDDVLRGGVTITR